MSDILNKTRKAMAEGDIDVLVASSPENVTYLGGVSPPSQKIVRSRHAFCIVPADGPTTYIVIQLEERTVRPRIISDRIVVYEEFADDPIAVAARTVTELVGPDNRVGVETTHLPARDMERLTHYLPRADVKPCDEMFERLRLLKTPEEIAKIRHIGHVAERAALGAVENAAVGDTERSIGNAITEAYLAGGGDQLTMLVVASGERSAEPNGPPTDKKIAPGDVVRIDVIGTMDNYYSDVARTAVAGEPTPEQQKMWDVLREGHERTIAAMRPGVLTSDLYKDYAALMDDAGLPRYHFLGHGLGVTLHEEPFLSMVHDVRLEEDMVMCVEPLSLIGGRFGMQLEDEVVITRDGCEPLTAAGPLLTIGERP